MAWDQYHVLENINGKATANAMSNSTDDDGSMHGSITLMNLNYIIFTPLTYRYAK